MYKTFQAVTVLPHWFFRLPVSGTVHASQMLYFARVGESTAEACFFELSTEDATDCSKTAKTWFIFTKITTQHLRFLKLQKRSSESREKLGSTPRPHWQNVLSSRTGILNPLFITRSRKDAVRQKSFACSNHTIDGILSQNTHRSTHRADTVHNFPSPNRAQGSFARNHAIKFSSLASHRPSSEHCHLMSSWAIFWTLSFDVLSFRLPDEIIRSIHRDSNCLTKLMCSAQSLPWSSETGSFSTAKLALSVVR